VRRETTCASAYIKIYQRPNSPPSTHLFGLFALVRKPKGSKAGCTPQAALQRPSPHRALLHQTPPGLDTDSSARLSALPALEAAPLAPRSLACERWDRNRRTGKKHRHGARSTLTTRASTTLRPYTSTPRGDSKCRLLTPFLSQPGRAKNIRCLVKLITVFSWSFDC